MALGKPVLDGLVAAGVPPDERSGNVVGPTASWSPTPLPWGFVLVTATSADRQRMHAESTLRVAL